MLQQVVHLVIISLSMDKLPLNMILKTTSFLLCVSVITCTALMYSLPGIWTHNFLGVIWSTMLVENIIKERLKFNSFTIQVSVILLFSMLSLVHIFILYYCLYTCTLMQTYPLTVSDGPHRVGWVNIYYWYVTVPHPLVLMNIKFLHLCSVSWFSFFRIKCTCPILP